MNDDPTTFSTVMGMVMHAEAERARQEERAAVVAWLREQVSSEQGAMAYLVMNWALAIERGEHRPKETAP